MEWAVGEGEVLAPSEGKKQIMCVIWFEFVVGRFGCCAGDAERRPRVGLQFI